MLPECYEGNNIHVDVQGQSVLSCFIRHADGTVTCPMGQTLFKHQGKKHGTHYGSREACRSCPNRCTDAKIEKTVPIGYNSTVVPVLIYCHLRYPLQLLPKDYVITPNNHSLGRKGRAKETVRVTFKRNKARQQIRKERLSPNSGVNWSEPIAQLWYHEVEKTNTDTEDKRHGSGRSYTGQRNFERVVHG